MSDSRKGPSERLAYLENKIEHLIRQGHIHEDAIRELKYKLSLEQVSDAPNPKPIDWSKVGNCVPVKTWDDDHESQLTVLYLQEGMRGLNTWSAWDNVSLITGIDIAWSGGECPLPEGLLIDLTLRSGEFVTGNPSGDNYINWNHSVNMGDIISFRVTGIADGWTEEVTQ